MPGSIWYMISDICDITIVSYVYRVSFILSCGYRINVKESFMLNDVYISTQTWVDVFMISEWDGSTQATMPPVNIVCVSFTAILRFIKKPNVLPFCSSLCFDWGFLSFNIVLSPMYCTVMKYYTRILAYFFQ